jgi:hypothetical protein
MDEEIPQIVFLKSVKIIPGTKYHLPLPFGVIT